MDRLCQLDGLKIRVVARRIEFPFFSICDKNFGWLGRRSVVCDCCYEVDYKITQLPQHPALSSALFSGALPDPPFPPACAPAAGGAAPPDCSLL